MLSIRAVLFDMIGTTVVERDPLFVNHCFEKAFLDHGIIVNGEWIRENRGRDKKEAITSILEAANVPALQTESILGSLKMHIRNNLDNFQEKEGIKDIIEFLKQKNIYVGIGTGLSADLFQQIFEYLNWQVYGFDFIGIAEKVGRGRPHPDMILTMLEKFSVEPSAFLKVGDTVADILEGKNAGVLTAAIESGTQEASELRKHKPDFMIRSLYEITRIIDK